MSYVLRDVLVVLGLAAATARVDSWLVWPLYWAAQGTMFWALFVLGHDCGHGSFSSNQKLNSVVGHILHSSILVPYNGWRISHRTHHQNHGHVEKDESWHPLPQRLYNNLDNMTKKLRFSLPFPMLAFPLYLFFRTPGKTGSHFNPNSDVFLPNEKKDVLTSTASWLAMIGVLAGLTFVMGPFKMLKLYAIPYVIFVMWLDFVTYLHHHGHEDRVPWYRGKETPKIIRIPFRILIDLMLKDLGLSEAEYRPQQCEDGKFCVAVLFSTSVLPVTSAATCFSMTGIYSQGAMKELKILPVKKVITYIEEATNTIVTDLSYKRLLEVKGQNKCLLLKLKQAHEYKKELARGWFLAVRHMSSFSKQALSIVYLNYSDGQTHTDTVWNNLLDNFRDMAFRGLNMQV